MTRLNLLSCSKEELAEHLGPLDLPAYRLDQVWQWVYERLETKFKAFTNLPADLRNALKKRCSVVAPEVVATVSSADGKTHKLALAFQDGARIECVLMLHRSRRPTLCISSQAGCAQGCLHCATGTYGPGRNLNPWEFVQQVWRLRQFSRRHLGRDLGAHNVVVMGMGEPLANLANLIEGVRLLTSKETFDISNRAITVSTVGIPTGIRTLARADLGVSLALSLNAPNDTVRWMIMPGQRRRPIAKILAAARYFFDETHRRVTLEYVLIEGVNASGKDMRKLAALVRRTPFHVNLIPYNAVGARSAKEFKPPEPKRCRLLADLLRKQGIKATLRFSQGEDIRAACGQLAPKKSKRQS